MIFAFITLFGGFEHTKFVDVIYKDYYSLFIYYSIEIISL